MKKEKIEELYCANQTGFTYEDDLLAEMTLTDFTNAINQAELEWYKKLKKKIGGILVNLYSPTVHQDLEKYFIEIKKKIKKLENKN